jgi:hypothetical protein
LLQKWQKKMGFKAHIPNYRTGQLTLIATSAGKTSTANYYSVTTGRIIADYAKS